MTTPIPPVHARASLPAERPARRRGRGFADDVLAPAVSLLLWAYAFVVGLLGLWVVMGIVLAGWSPTTLTTGSIGSGDVLMVAELPDEGVGPQAVITAAGVDGEQVAHRVVAVEGDEYVTSADPDAGLVAARDVTGVGRMVVPLVGLPLVWLTEGAWVAFGAWLVLTLATAAHLSFSLAGRLRRRQDRRSAPPGAVAGRAVRSLRLLTALMLTIHYVVAPERLTTGSSNAGGFVVLVGTVIVLIGTNILGSRLAAEDETTRRRAGLLELAVDTALVVTISTITGTDSIGWILFALPVIEATMRYGLAGGLAQWSAVATMGIGARILVDDAGRSELLGDLERMLDQLSVLFIVVIPGAYLAEHLIGDVHQQARATRSAQGRGHLLERVVRSGRQVNELGDRPFEALVDGAVALGFDAADIVHSTDGRRWQVLACSSAGRLLPPPGRAASGVRPADLRHGAVVVDAGDPEPEEHAAMARLQLARVTAHRVAAGSQGTMVLRTAQRALDDDGEDARLDALRLLAAQAGVAIRNDRLLAELTAMHDALAHQASHDSLTGLANRAQLLEHLDGALEAHRDVAVLFLDLDGFKGVNDRLGHDAGDLLLKIVAKRLTNVVDDGGLVARLGGDEFTVLLVGAGAHATAPSIARDIKASFVDPIRIDGDTAVVGTSIGMALSDGRADAGELLRRADVAMYHAKHVAGPGAPFVEYDRQLDANDLRRADLTNSLLSALGDGSIRLVYQPIVHVDGMAHVAGMEALVRWEHPRYGPVSPEEIVELAAKAGLLDGVNRWIVRRAARDLGRLVAEHGLTDLFMTVNLSPDELASPQTVSHVREAIDETGIDPDRFFLEISERLVDPDAPAASATMEALLALGTQLLLDDFGEGHTSLAFLHRLPVTGIKIDRKLVLQSIGSERERIIVESIVELSDRLGLAVIAEGVETAQHLHSIVGMGCVVVQGYYLHRPLTIEAVDELLAEPSRRSAAARQALAGEVV